MKGFYIDGLIYPSANADAGGANIVLKKSVIDSGDVYCDHVQMYAMHRDPKTTEPIFSYVSNAVTPAEDGSFGFSYIA